MTIVRSRSVRLPVRAGVPNLKGEMPGVLRAAGLPEPEDGPNAGELLCERHHHAKTAAAAMPGDETSRLVARAMYADSLPMAARQEPDTC